MKDHEFWRLIQRARKEHQHAAAGRAKNGGNYRLTTSWYLVGEVSRLVEDYSLAELIKFQDRLCEIHRRAHRWEVYTAFGIAFGGVDELEIDGCISWLILQGKRTFANVLVGPDRIGTMPLTRQEVSHASGLGGVVHELLAPDEDDEDDEDAKLIEARIDELIDDPAFIELVSEEPKYDLAQLRRRYPRLTARYLQGDQLPDEPFVTRL